MAGHDIVVIGASAGGVETLVQLVQLLPADLPAALFICLHVPSNSTSVMPAILNRSGKIPASHPRNGSAIVLGHIYVAPPDLHLQIRNGVIHTLRGPKENSHRPAIDPMFRSAALAYRSRVVGVVLSGTLDDGTGGLSVIKRFGGIAIAQDPDEALFPGMPRSAIENVDIDYVLPIAEIARKIVDLVSEPSAERDWDVPESVVSQLNLAERDMEGEITLERSGSPSVYTCPECHGTLWEVQEGDLMRFRCRTGHAFSSESLLSEQDLFLETALWTALRALEEKEDMSRRLLERAQARGMTRTIQQFEEQAIEAAEHASIIRHVLQESRKAPMDEGVHQSKATSVTSGENAETDAG